VLNIARGHRHLLLNRADDAVGISAEKVESILGMDISARVATSMEIAAATNAGNPIVAEKPNHPSSAAFIELAGKVAGVSVDALAGSLNGVSVDGKARGGLFRRRKEAAR
jgi:pilus assembly protein CpaE